MKIVITTTFRDNDLQNDNTEEFRKRQLLKKFYEHKTTAVKNDNDLETTRIYKRLEQYKNWIFDP